MRGSCFRIFFLCAPGNPRCEPSRVTAVESLSHNAGLCFYSLPRSKALTSPPSCCSPEVSCWPESLFCSIFIEAPLPHGRIPIASHTSLFTGVMPCQSPVDLCPTNRLNFSSRGQQTEGELLITAFFLPPRSRGKRLECEERQRREVSRLVCWVGGESGPICILCSVARSWEPQAGSAKFDPKARAAAVSAAAAGSR